MRSTLVSLVAVGLAAVMVQGADKGKQWPAVPPVVGGPTSHGCYSSKADDMKAASPAIEFMASGSCNTFCKNQNSSVSALQGSDCYCGDMYPPKADLADDKKCNYPCQYYDLEACGGLDDSGYFSVFNTGVKVAVQNQGDDNSKPTKSTGTDTQPTGPGSTLVVTQTNAPSQGGPNVAAIAAGVVVAVIAVLGIVGGVFFYMRRKRNKEIEEEHRRNAAVNSFIGSAKPPSSSSGLSMTDSRMDPSLANRRMSDGSIADNQDYSRKILRVTNA